MLPGHAAVGRLEQAAPGTGEVAVLPRPLPRLPQDGVDGLRIRRVEGHVDRTGILIAIEHFLKRHTAVGGAKDAALLVRSVRMSEHCDEEAIGIGRIDLDHRNLLTVAQPEVLPALSAVRRFVNAVTGREIGAMEALA